MTTRYELRPISYVESPLVDPKTAPKQGLEGTPDAWLVFNADVTRAIRDLATGAEVFVLTWLHQARRDVLAVHPRDDPRNPVTGVFSTRSQDRPNPIGLHRVQIAAINGHRVLVRDLEAVDGMPIVNVKPVLAGERWPTRGGGSRGHGQVARDSRRRARENVLDRGLKEGDMPPRTYVMGKGSSVDPSRRTVASSATGRPAQPRRRSTLTPSEVLYLQRTGGNRAVHGLVQMLQMEPGCIALEREANQVAEAADDLGRDTAIPMIRGRATSGRGGIEVYPAVEDGLRSPGSPLDRATRAYVEDRLDHKFSGVRIHTGTQAERSAGTLDARAFTVGRDIVFGFGQYDPHSPEGERLLVHELAHVVQQAGQPSPAIQRQPVAAPDATGEEVVHRIDVQRHGDRLLVLVDGLAVAEVQLADDQPVLRLDVAVEEDLVQVVLRHQGGASLAAAPPAEMAPRFQVDLREIDEREGTGQGRGPEEPGASGAPEGFIEVPVVAPETVPLPGRGLEGPALLPPGAVSEFEQELHANPGLVDGVVLDPDTGEVIGYRQFATAGVARFLDREGELVTITEIGIEQPLIDPLDLIPSPGGAAKGTTLSAAVVFRLRGVSRAMLRRAARTFAAESASLVRRFTQEGIDHSFDRHAAQWFGGVVTRETHLAAWRALVERAAGSRHVVPWSVGAADTIAHLAYIEGKPFVVQFFRETGELATAFVPNSAQLSAMLRLLGRAG